MITEPELIGLLYRADWTRLALSGTVLGPGPVLDSAAQFKGPKFDSVVTEKNFWGQARTYVERLPWFHDEEHPDTRNQVEVAPGRRFRVDSANGDRAVGCDGERPWYWARAKTAGSEWAAALGGRPQPPYRVLLMPSWLLNGYLVTAEGHETVGGRSGLRIRATPKPGSQRAGRLSYRASPRLLNGLPPLLREDLYDEVDAVVDSELGFLLRCSRRSGTHPPLVLAFESVAAGSVAAAPASRFAAPAGSGYGGATAARSPLESLGREAAKTAAGLAAGGLGALLRVAPSRPSDPFAQATTEDFDPDDAMPDDEPAPVGAGSSVSDEVLSRLYRSGTGVPRCAATLHEWFDLAALLHAVPGPARQAGFGGVGYLVDTVRERMQDDDPVIPHQVSDFRLGGWREFRIDLRRRSPLPGKSRFRGDWDTRQPGTVAADGTREWRVYADRVEVRPAGAARPELGDLLDLSWLLECDLSDGSEITVAGRRGLRVVARARDTAGWWNRLLFPAVVVVDTETGLPLRLTRFTGGRPATSQELRDFTELGPDADFGFSPPADRPLEEQDR